MDSYDVIFDFAYFLYKLDAIKFDTLHPFIDLPAVDLVEQYCARIGRGIKV